MLPNIVMYFAASIMPVERVASFLSMTVGDFRLGPFDAISAAFALAYVPFGFRLMYSMLAVPKVSEPKSMLNMRAVVQDLRKSDWFVAASEICYDNYQETVYFFVAAILAGVQTGVQASVLSNYATMWLLMRVLYIVVSYAAMGKYVPIAMMRTPLFLTNIAVLTQMFSLAQAAYDAPPVKKGFF
jgi:uncharacterized MAPEG superfamily protein